MKPVVEIQGQNNLDEYKAVSLLQLSGSLTYLPLPLPVNKEAIKVENKGKADFKDHVLDVIEIVHGSSKTKKDLAKVVQEKLPQLKGRNDVKTFLTTYCSRSRDGAKSIGNEQNRVSTDSRKPRQMVNADKIIEDNMLKSVTQSEEKPEELKARVIRKLDDILEARQFAETENRAIIESANKEEAKAIAAENEETIPTNNDQPIPQEVATVEESKITELMHEETAHKEDAPQFIVAAAEQ